MMHLILYTLISVLVVSLISLVGIFSLFFHSSKLDRWLLILVSLSAGTLFGGAFLHLLPEIVEKKKGFTLEISLLVLAGIVLFFILEKLIHWHRCNKIHLHPGDEKEHLGALNLMGDGIHNFLDGLIIAGSYLLNPQLGLVTTLAVVLHEVPQELADFGVLLYSGYSRTKALLLNFASAAIAIIGAIVGLALGAKGEWFVDMIIPFAAGGFIYIAGSNLVPELHKECRVLKESFWHLLAILLGIVLTMLV